LVGNIAKFAQGFAARLVFKTMVINFIVGQVNSAIYLVEIPNLPV
jgi:molybdopterin-binding protein